ncbi:TPA: hypothetical protein ACH3X1_014482 [Trebouxia sp. C0004]
MFSVLPPTPPTTQLYELPDYEPIPNFVDHSQPEGPSGPPPLAGDSNLASLPECLPDSNTMGFFVKHFTAQLCYNKWGYEWLRANSEQLEALSPDIATDVQTVIASIMDERKNKQAAVPGRLSLPAEDEPSGFTLTDHAGLPSAQRLIRSAFAMPPSPVPSLPASGSALPILTTSGPAAVLSNVPASGGASLSLPASSSALLPTMSTPNSKSKLSQKIKQFDKITPTSDIQSWLEDVAMTCALNDTPQDKWVLAAGANMTGSPSRYFKTAFRKAQTSGDSS